jgi:tRNA dimethylallyltransferase
MQSVGYGEIVAYLGGVWDLAQARELIERHTWRLAKRQMTWFRHLPGIHWISLTETPESTAIQIVHSLLAQAQDRSPEALPALPAEDQAPPCACPVPM